MSLIDELVLTAFNWLDDSDDILSRVPMVSKRWHRMMKQTTLPEYRYVGRDEESATIPEYRTPVIGLPCVKQFQTHDKIIYKYSECFKDYLEKAREYAHVGSTIKVISETHGAPTFGIPLKFSNSRSYGLSIDFQMIIRPVPLYGGLDQIARIVSWSTRDLFLIDIRIYWDSTNTVFTALQDGCGIVSSTLTISTPWTKETTVNINLFLAIKQYHLRKIDPRIIAELEVESPSTQASTRYVFQVLCREMIFQLSPLYPVPVSAADATLPSMARDIKESWSLSNTPMRFFRILAASNVTNVRGGYGMSKRERDEEDA